MEDCENLILIATKELMGGEYAELKIEYKSFCENDLLNLINVVAEDIVDRAYKQTDMCVTITLAQFCLKAVLDGIDTAMLVNGIPEDKREEIFAVVKGGMNEVSIYRKGD